MCSIAAASAVAGFVGQQQQASAANAQAAQNAALAREAASLKYSTAQRNFSANSRATNREAFDAELKARDAKAKGNASAGDSGVTGISLTNLIAEVDQRNADNLGRVQDKKDNLLQTYKTTTFGAEQEARARIASMPMTDGPNPLGLAINLAGAAYENKQKTGEWFPSLFK